MDVAHLGRFGHSLASHQDPRFLEPLGHDVTPEAPAGRVDGLAAPAAAGLPRPLATLVQRMSFGDPAPAESATAAADDPVEVDRGPAVTAPAQVDAAPERPDIRVTATPPVQRSAVRGTEATASGRRPRGDGVPTPSSTPSQEPVEPTATSETGAPTAAPEPLAPTAASEPTAAPALVESTAVPVPVEPTPIRGGAALLGDEPLAAGPRLDGGTPVQRATVTTPVPSRSGEPRSPVTASRLVRPSSTAGSMPAPPVRPAPVVSDDRPPSGSDATAVDVPTPTPPGVTLGSDVTVARSVVPAATPPGSDPAGGPTAPAVQRLAAPPLPPETPPPAPTLHWPPAGREHAPVAVLPVPALVPATGATGAAPVGAAGSAGAALQRSAPVDVGNRAPTAAVPRVQRAVHLPPDVPPSGVAASGGPSRGTFAPPTIAAPTIAPPTFPPSEPTPTEFTRPTTAPAEPPGARWEVAGPAVAPGTTRISVGRAAASGPVLQRSVAPAATVAAPGPAPALVPLAPLPSQHRGALPPPATQRPSVVPDAPFVSRSSAGGWTEVGLPEPAGRGPATLRGPLRVATADVQRQRDAQPEPSPDAEVPAAGEADAPGAAAVAAVTPVVAPADAPADSPGGPNGPAATPGAKAADLDELARRLYEPLTARLRAELWLDRERTGRSMTR